MLINGTPALFKVGLKDILFGTVWKPTAKEPSFGILYIIPDFNCWDGVFYSNRMAHRCADRRFPGGGSAEKLP